MREIRADEIKRAVKKLCMDANYYLPQDVIDALRKGYEREVSPIGKDILKKILKNIEVAGKQKLPLCQDTGVAVFFIDLGQEVKIVGKSLEDAINEGVREGYSEGYLRKSMVADPLFDRTNTKDNTPCIMHIRIVRGNKVRIAFVPKGGGAENMSRVAMLKPADGVKGVKRFVIQTVEEAGPNPCPPLIIGVGIGGDFEEVSLLAKRALLRKIGQHNPNARYAELEDELLVEINRLGIGPQGLGGRITALAVNIEHFPCHIASLPVAVNLQCHAARHKEIEI
ncbi:fumarate hydratase [Candidatus Aerophobetes bacterium]|uniref:Fumarate hydratase n=1 Tax=Aerophobetes bacterium TaxID=2030807 RepID=A0A497E5J4_UNCAE|nr:MAG: fumarate hydratase [Candidatus Aerophobetes bacterium]